VTFICPRCQRNAIQADGYTYCTRCRNERQAKSRQTQTVVTTINCHQCRREGEKHPDFRLCIACGEARVLRCKRGGLKSREEATWMRGFDPLSQEFLKRRLI
jgi:hypothetical protein